MLALALLFSAQTSHRIMTYDEYAKVDHGRPYVLEITQGDSRFIYFGVGHTHDPKDPQIAKARELWQKLKPEIALNESQPRMPAETLERSIERDGESGAIAFWSKAEGVETRSLDMGRKEEIEQLARLFPMEQLKAFYVVRSLQELSRRPESERGNRTPEQVVNANLILALSRGMKGSPRNAPELDSLWPAWKMPSDWRTPSASWFDPGNGGAGTPFNKIATASSQARDQYMVDRIVELMKSGKRAFCTMGASHVVMQEPAIRAALPHAKVTKLIG